MVILLSLLIVALIIACFLYYLFSIVPKQIEKEVNEEMENQEKHREDIKIKLNDKLINICPLFAIPLEYKTDLGDAAGHILYHRDKTGRILLDQCKIEVLTKYLSEPWVLAHELGHYIAMKKHQDNSEKMADKMAKELCCTLLSKQEQKDISYSLDAYFGD